MPQRTGGRVEFVLPGAGSHRSRILLFPGEFVRQATIPLNHESRLANYFVYLVVLYMKNQRIVKSTLVLLFAVIGLSAGAQNLKTDKGHEKNPYYSTTDTRHLNVTNAEWKKILSPGLYAVAREQDTEPAFTGTMWKSFTKGTYYCAVCGNALFKSDSKFASQCGWPSFFEAIRPNSVNYKEDHSYGMSRTEVTCARCDSHLGHIFDDGPPPTGKRFCMNTISLDFLPELKASK